MNATQCERHSFWNIEHSSSKTIEINANVDLSRCCNYEKFESNFIIWCNYIIIIWWNALMNDNCNNCTIALHQKKIFDVFESAIQKSKILFFWKFEFSIDSKKHESIIAIYRRLFNNLKFYRFFDRFFDKNWYFVKKINIQFRIFEQTKRFIFDFVRCINAMTNSLKSWLWSH